MASGSNLCAVVKDFGCELSSLCGGVVERLLVARPRRRWTAVGAKDRLRHLSAHRCRPYRSTMNRSGKRRLRRRDTGRSFGGSVGMTSMPSGYHRQNEREEFEGGYSKEGGKSFVEEASPTSGKLKEGKGWLMYLPCQKYVVTDRRRRSGSVRPWRRDG